MIVRKALRCESCDGVTITRTAIGHRQRQTHRFPCRRCGIEIVYAVLLDQDTVDGRYQVPRNAQWLTGVDADTADDECVAVLSFDSELLAAREGTFSPFMATQWRFVDYQAFERDEVLRDTLRTNLWGALTQLLSHFDTRRDDLFDRVARRKFGRVPDGDTRIDRLNVLHDETARFLRTFTFEVDDITMQVGERIGAAHRANPTLLQEFVETIVSNGFAAELWRQIHDLHREFMNVWESLSPILNLRYWKSEPGDLAEFSVTTKDFERLRHFYVSCFETIAQLSVLGIGVEAIVSYNEVSIPAKKRSLQVVSGFAELGNANKADHLKKHPPLDRLFVQHMRSEIRNGIGHHSSSYDFESDEVVCVKSSSGTMEETYRENYTLFCRRILSMMSSIARLETYVYVLVVLVDGEYRPDDATKPDAAPPEPPRGIESSMTYRTI